MHFNCKEINRAIIVLQVICFDVEMRVREGRVV